MEQSGSLTNDIDYLKIGHTEISLTDWTDGAEPEITAGSTLEIGGSIFLATGDDDLDVAAAWGGIANSTLVYIYYAVSGTTATAELSTTAPTWDDEKQGWYDAGLTKRCVGSIYKDSGGNYDQKTIFLSQFHGKTYAGMNIGNNAANADKNLRFASDVNFFWDESENEWVPTKGIQLYNSLDGAADIQIATHTGAGGTASADFTIMKPIACYGHSTAGAGEAGYVELKYSGGYVDIGFSFSPTPTDFGNMLNPGTYRIRHAGGNHTTTLYAVGTYGSNTVTASEIVS